MIPYKKGIIAEQAHVNIPDGLHEEEFARQGFFGKYVHFYRTHAPVDWAHIEGPLKPRSYDLNNVNSDHNDFLFKRRPYLENEDCKILYYSAKTPQTMPYFFRNADYDELYFVHKGHGKFDSDFGAITFRQGDYIVIPRGTTYRIAQDEACEFLIIESNDEFELPDKGMLGQHSLFDPAVVQTPEAYRPADISEKEHQLKIKRCGEITTVTYPFSPVDVVGWKGTLSLWKVNVEDIRPVSCDRYHLPPSAHTTFVTKGFVVCSFLPRPLENGDEQAMKVPFYHSNIDFDEVIFYHSGEFFSRAGIDTGMLTFHPQGIHHGPHKNAITRTQDNHYTHEVAVMIDTKRPLKPTAEAEQIENKDYWRSWMSQGVKND